MPSAKSASRASANSTENVSISVNEKILRECHKVYVPKGNDDEDKGKNYFLTIFLF